MTTQPTPLPPEVAELRLTIEAWNKTSCHFGSALDELCDLASRAADAQKERGAARAEAMSLDAQLAEANRQLDAALADRSIRDAEADGRRIQDLTEQLAAAQKERDEAIADAKRRAAECEELRGYMANGHVARERAEAELAAAKDAGAKVVELARKAQACRQVWNDIPASGLRDDNARDNFIEASFRLIDGCLDAQPQPKTAEPATVRQGDAILGQYMRAVDTCVDRSFDDIVMRELCRRALEAR